jgi:hypothetical protein
MSYYKEVSITQSTFLKLRTARLSVAPFRAYLSTPTVKPAYHGCKAYVKGK